MPKFHLYDLLAPLYGRVIPDLYNMLTFRTAKRLVAGGPSNVLEVGLGPGHILSEVGRKASVPLIGLDISYAMLKQARRRLKEKNITAFLVCADGTDMPFADGSFDGVVASFLLDLFPQAKIPGALREMARVLAPGGRIVVASMQFSSPFLRVVWMLAYKVMPSLVGRLRPIDFTQFLEDSGLRVLNDEVVAQGAGTRLLTLMKVRG
ncbi:MAG: methyltransferase domain-containing protein [Gemmatimonadota bacterium]|nr:methyltransferase domain-containing protein [Gemmatimonadota bacterium]MDH5804153.1 methyltransferase domain-containing protein [Gemmatimonadota bacterium]